MIKTQTDGHMFSIVLKGKEHIKNLTLSDNDAGNIIVEGFLGQLRSIDFADDVMLEIKADNGTLRLDLAENELCQLLSKKAAFHERKKGKTK